MGSWFSSSKEEVVVLESGSATTTDDIPEGKDTFWSEVKFKCEIIICVLIAYVLFKYLIKRFKNKYEGHIRRVTSDCNLDDLGESGRNNGQNK